jgi:hypothetical protein
MNGSLLRSLALLAGCVLVGCADTAPAQTPPPLPALPTLVAAPAVAEPVEAYAAEGAAPHEGKPSKSKPRSQPAAASTPAKQAHKPKAEPHTKTAPSSPSLPASPTLPASPSVTPAPPPAAAPAAIAVPAARPVASAKKVVVPSTPNVHIDFPLGLQNDLNADPRMQSWVDKVIAIVDGCHAKNRSATGAISTRITMHENERPDADILALPGPLSSVVTCATGALMRIKMPLFTGHEGTRYDVRIVFE